MPRTVRFAPSPTGLIHIGNARTALFNWLFARGEGGRFILRFDDTDRERSRAEYAEAIVRDLAWIGIQPDVTVRQSDRLDLYHAAVERLKAAGRLYACYETPDELERKRKRQLARGLPPVYDRAALKLGDGDRQVLEAEGRRPHWRFLLERRAIAWDDLVRGPQTVDTGSLSDPVLVRADGSYLYTLPSVVDDVELGVSHVVRGEDHVANTAAQIELFEALGATPPVFGHHNLLTTASGEGLSKRLGHLSLAGLREAGYEPMTVASLAVLIGTSEPVEPWPDLETLGTRFDFSKVSRAPAKFDQGELAGLNARLVHELPYSAVAERLAAFGIPADEALWLAVRANCQMVGDAALWARAVDAAQPVVAEDDRGFVREAATMLPPEPWGEATWKEWTDAVKAATGRKGKNLYMPLRLALTGLDHGPELARLLPLIGRDRTSARLS